MFDLITFWFGFKTILFIIAIVAGILFVLFGDDGLMSEEEYIRLHPEEFKR